MDDAELTHGLFNALEAGEFDQFAGFFKEGAVIWHNFDNLEQSVAEAAAVLSDLRSRTEKSRYEQRRYFCAPGGAVAQHVVRATRLDGRIVEIPAMLRIFIESGKIHRIEEYFDIGQSAQIFAP
jgi:ketosteroid isomerase-like protein